MIDTADKLVAAIIRDVAELPGDDYDASEAMTVNAYDLRIILERNLEATNSSLHAEIERLRGALAPFVDAANTYEAEGYDDDKCLYFTLGELKEARAALGERHG